jgi:Na+-driven multidrug efflux pump
MVLDPIFIFGFGPFPGMGIAGGAIATVIGRAMSMVIALAVIIFREKLITLDRVPFREVLSSWKKILFVGIPAALSNLIIPVTMGVITRLVASFGTSAVAGFGVATRLEMLVMLVIRALASVMIPFSGQNWGAGLLDRVKTALKSSYIIAAVWSLVLFVLLFIFGKPVVSLFNKDPQIVETAVLYLRIVAASYSFQGILLVSVASLNALNKPIHSILISLFHAAGLYVPLALAGTALWGLKGIFIAAFAANTIAGIGAALTAFRQTNHV